MKTEEKIKARELRQNGLSIKKIAKIIGVSCGSVHLWVKDIRLTEEQKNAIKNTDYGNIKLGIAKRSNNFKLKRDKWEIAGYERAKKDKNFALMAALYWGEGSKSRHEEFRVANCDPDMLRIVFNWLVKETDRKISFSVIFHNENGLTENAIKSWWMEQIPGLKDCNFRKFHAKDTSKFKVKKVGKVPYGTGYVRVNSVELHMNIMGGIRYIKEKLFR